jgi:hypothetical protein
MSKEQKDKVREEKSDKRFEPPYTPQPTQKITKNYSPMLNFNRPKWDSNPQSLPPESNALPLGHQALSNHWWKRKWLI